MATLARRAQARGVTAGIAALLLLAGCGRGTPEQRVSSRGSKPVPGTEVPPPIEAPTTSTTAAPATATSAVPVPTSTTANTATQAPVSGPCATPVVTEFALSAIGGKPTTLAAAPDGSIWFADTGVAAIGRLRPDGAVRMFPLSGGRQPAGIAVASDGDVWFTQYRWYNPVTSDPSAPPSDPSASPPAIGLITPGGSMTEFPLPTGQANMMGSPETGASPFAITAGPDRAMWFTEMGADQIGRVTNEGLITEYPLPSRSTFHANPEGITAGPDGAIWFTEALANKLGRIDPASGAITDFSAFPEGSRGISASVTAGSDGALWFDNINAPVIGRMTTSGRMTTVQFPGDRYKATSLIAGPDGGIWFFDQQKPAIGRLPAKGQPIEVATVSGGPNQYVTSGAMALDHDRNLWFVESAANKLARITCRG